MAAIVLLAENGAKLVEPALISVLREAQEASPAHEVLVADPHGREEISRLVRGRSGARLLTRSGEGAAAVMNASAASAASSHIVLMEAGRVPAGKGYLAPLLTPFARAERGLFGTALGGGEETYGPWHGAFQSGCLTLRGEPTTLSLGLAAYDRALWAVLGGFDPRYATRVWAEADLGWRARRRGWRLQIVGAGPGAGKPTAALDSRVSIRPPLPDPVAFERDRLVFAWKNFGSALTARHLAWLPWRTVGPGSVRRRAVTALAAAVSDLGEVRRARRFERTMARLTDREVLTTFEGA